MAEFGIACEACHGPAQQHVQFHRATSASLQAKHGDQPRLLFDDQGKLDVDALQRLLEQRDDRPVYLVE